MSSFWKNLPKPFFVLAPLSDVTDAAFRCIIAKYGKPDVFFTEFVSCAGLLSDGREALLHNFKYSEEERPIVAQVFGADPKHFYECAKIVSDLGFDGIDINMGCPDRSVEKQGAGAALIKDPKRARKIIKETKRGAGKMPVSVKTRIGYNKNELDAWLTELLAEEPAAITIHARTRKELSKVPAHWDEISRAVEIRNKLGSKTLIIGNGDVKDITDGRKKAQESDVDGVMLGRAVFGNPWLFANLAHTKCGCKIEHPAPILPLGSAKNKIKANTSLNISAQSRNSAERSECAASVCSCKNGAGSHNYHNITTEEKLRVMIEHTKLFEKLLSGDKNFAVMKKHYKAYVCGWDGAKELRIKIMGAQNAKEVESIVKESQPFKKSS